MKLGANINQAGTLVEGDVVTFFDLDQANKVVARLFTRKKADGTLELVVESQTKVVQAVVS